jgi:hypothetical protein
VSTTGNRKAIASIGTGPQSRLLRLAARSFRPYAERHGYDLHLRDTPVETTRPVPWSKIPLLRELNRRYDHLLWLDADLVIVDGHKDLAGELPPDKLLGMVRHTTKDGVMPNSGVLIMRCGDEAERFLDEVWAQQDLTTHRWWENAAICRLLGYSLDPVGPGDPTPWLAQTAFLDPRWNSITDAPAAHPYIRHYPGYSLKTRTAFMLRDLGVARVRRATGRR